MEVLIIEIFSLLSQIKDLEKEAKEKGKKILEQIEDKKLLKIIEDLTNKKPDCVLKFFGLMCSDIVEQEFLRARIKNKSKIIFDFLTKN